MIQQLGQQKQRYQSIQSQQVLLLEVAWTSQLRSFGSPRRLCDGLVWPSTSQQCPRAGHAGQPDSTRKGSKMIFKLNPLLQCTQWICRDVFMETFIHLYLFSDLIKIVYKTYWSTQPVNVPFLCMFLFLLHWLLRPRRPTDMAKGTRTTFVDVSICWALLVFFMTCSYQIEVYGSRLRFPTSRDNPFSGLFSWITRTAHGFCQICEEDTWICRSLVCQFNHVVGWCCDLIFGVEHHTFQHPPDEHILPEFQFIQKI